MIIPILFGCFYALQFVVHTLHPVPQEDQIAILGFHNVVKDEEKAAYYANNMWVDSESSFKAKIQYLYEEGYTTWTLEELYEWKQGKREKEGNVVVLTFDDGYYASSALIAPILEQYGYRGATFVVGSYLEGAHTWDGSRLQFLNEQDLQDQHVMQYYSHTYQLHDKEDGKFLIDVRTKEQLIEDFQQQSNITSMEYYAYPYGHANDTIVEVCKENGVKLAFGYNENRKATREDDPYRLPRFAITAYTSLDSLKAMLESDA